MENSKDGLVVCVQTTSTMDLMVLLIISEQEGKPIAEEDLCKMREELEVRGQGEFLHNFDKLLKNDPGFKNHKRTFDSMGEKEKDKIGKKLRKEHGNIFDSIFAQLN